MSMKKEWYLQIHQNFFISYIGEHNQY